MSNNENSNHDKKENLKIWIGKKTRKETILVTGSSGFVGQHIVKCLQDHSKNVKEIVLFDIKPYPHRLKHSGSIPMRQIIGSVTKLDDARKALKGVDSVIHTAGLVDFSSNADIDNLNEVNVKGTANIIQASVENSVGKLVYTSSVDVVIGQDDLINVAEGDCPIPKKLLFEGYPESKRQAENLVLKANGRVLGNKSISENEKNLKNQETIKNFDEFNVNKQEIISKKHLQTLSLRPNVLYGEEDPYYVKNALKSAENNNGVLYRVGNGSAMFQQAYVGNIAYAHLCALKAMSDDPHLGGKAFFVTDDTPCMNAFTFMENFLPLHGFRLSSWYIPYSVAYSAFWTFELIIKVTKPLYKINTNANLASIIYICKSFTFNRQSFEDFVGYKPIFTYEESLERSKNYYMHCLAE